MRWGNRSNIWVVAVVIGVIAVLIGIAVFIQSFPAQYWGYGTSAPYRPQPYNIPMGGPRGYGMYSCPIGGSYTTIDRSNVVSYVENYVKTIGQQFEVRVIEEYTGNFYVIVWDKERSMGAFEILVYRNGVIHPEPHSMMWNTLYGPHASGSVGWHLSLEDAKTIAQKWLEENYPGSEIVEEYIFPGYYTFHFKADGEMQMLSVNAYTGQVWFHSWHGNYIGNVFGEDEESKHN